MMSAQTPSERSSTPARPRRGAHARARPRSRVRARPCLHAVSCSFVALLLLAAWYPAPAGARTLRIVAAENFYGDIAAQLAGQDAQVVSVLQNAAADPHLFEPGISTARAVAEADLVIYNGLAYDVWMARLLAGSRAPHRRVLVAASVAPRTAAGRNPHLWYDLEVMRTFARAITGQLIELDPAHRAQYVERSSRFLQSLDPIEMQIAHLRARFAGAIVAATEPIAQYLTDAIGLAMSNPRFQLAVMNGTEPSARETADFERSLRDHRVHVLIYNKQVASSAVERLLAIARQSRVPVVAMTETEPPGFDYQQWMLSELGDLGRALEWS